MLTYSTYSGRTELDRINGKSKQISKNINCNISIDIGNYSRINAEPRDWSLRQNSRWQELIKSRNNPISVHKSRNTNTSHHSNTSVDRTESNSNNNNKLNCLLTILLWNTNATGAIQILVDSDRKYTNFSPQKKGENCSECTMRIAGSVVVAKSSHPWWLPITIILSSKLSCVIALRNRISSSKGVKSLRIKHSLLPFCYERTNDKWFL